MQKQITLGGEIAEKEKILEFKLRKFSLRNVGLTKDNDCEVCSIVPKTDCPIYENCSGPIDNYGVTSVKGIGTIEIMAPKIYFRSSIKDFLTGQTSMVDYVSGD